MNIRSRKSLKTWLFVLFFLVASVTIVAANLKLPGKTSAGSCSVTLTGSPFSDPDAEDTHLASQWIVTEGGSGIYDSGRDTVNLTTIAIPGSYFTEAHTYNWKVRYQDQHFFWGDYSAEASFVYNCGADVTPTPTPTPVGPTPTAGPSDTSTSTPEGSTPTPTSSATETTVPTTPSESCRWGEWQYIDGSWVCAAASVMGAQVIEPNGTESFDSCNQMKISYVADPGIIGWNNLISASPTSTVTVTKDNNWRHDIYLSTDGATYHRIVNDFGYSGTWPWIETGLSGDYQVSGPLFSLNYYIPAETSISDQAKILVHTYNDALPASLAPLNWGDTVIPFGTAGQISQAYDTSDNNFQINSGCAGSTSTPIIFTDDGSHTDINVISPQTGDYWKIGSSYQVLWTTTKFGESAPDINKVNILLSLDGGRSFNEPLAVSIDNTGVSEVTALAKYKTNHAVIRVEPAPSQNFTRSGLSGEFVISDTGRPCGIFCSIINNPIDSINDILLFGALVASLLPAIIALIVSSPILARIAEAIIPALSHPFLFFYLWKRRKKWGIVYDSISKEPIPRAAIRLFTQPDEKLREIQYTDQEGKFGFLAPSGKYTIAATKGGFSFPTHLIHGSSDGDYGNIYKGEELVISKDQSEGKSPLKKINIPLDPSKASFTDLALLAFTQFIQSFFAFIRVPFMLLGVLLTIYVAFRTGAWYYWAILGVYVLLWIIEIRRMLLPQTYGLVQDETGKAVALVMIRVLDQNGRLKTTFVTGNDGKFNFSLVSGNYRFILSRVGYKGTRSDLIRVSKTNNLGRVNFKMVKISGVTN